ALDSASRDGKSTDRTTLLRSDDRTDLGAIRFNLLDGNLLRLPIRQEGGGNRADPGGLAFGPLAEPCVRRDQVQGVDELTSGEELVEAPDDLLQREQHGYVA